MKAASFLLDMPPLTHQQQCKILIPHSEIRWQRRSPLLEFPTVDLSYEVQNVESDLQYFDKPTFGLELRLSN